MSAVMSIHISGIAEIRKKLSPQVFRATLIDALRAGLTPVASAASALAPRKSGRLAQSIRAAISTRGGTVSGRIVTGAPYGHLVEYGHRLVAKGGRQIGTVPTHPFARPAFAAQQGAIASAIEQRLAQAISG